MRAFSQIGEPPRHSLEWLQQQDPAVRREALDELASDSRTEFREQSVDILAASLKDGNPGVQQAAVNGLIRMKGPLVVQRMVELLREPPAVRNMAVEVIEQSMPDAIEATLPVLDSADPNVRKLIVDAFGKQTDPRVIQPLVKLLADPNPNVRASAAEALGHLRAGAAVHGLIALLHDEEWVVFSAIGALAEIGDQAALAPLLDLIRHDQGAVRYAAVEAIAGLDRTGATAPVLAELVASADSALRPALIKTLVAIMGGRTNRAMAEFWRSLERPRWLGLLTEALGDEAPDTRLAAMLGLGLLGDRRGTQPILNAYRELENPTEEVADRVVIALVGTGDVQALMRTVASDSDPAGAVAIRALGELGSSEAVAALMQVRRTSHDWERRMLALRALGKIGTDEALKGITEAVEDRTGYIRCEAIRLLGESGHAMAGETLLTMLKAERYQDVRDVIVEALVRAGGHTVMVELAGQLEHSRPEVRAAAARAIGLAKLPEGLASLGDAMNDPEWRVREAAVTAIGCYDDAGALKMLLLALADDHERVRLAATLGVARWKTPEAKGALVAQCLRDPDVWVRYRAAECLGHQGATEAVPALAAILDNHREPALLQRAVVTALGSIGGTPAHAALTAFLPKADDDLRNAVTQALEECSRQSTGDAQPKGVS
ncbi:MAG: HEAT repeat domain-containing protein [Nitrospirae bacterium]|nr:HEAT repeat domain-containing protein [Nitrospirota bacterium]